jgi:hypothetical protein
VPHFRLVGGHNAGRFVVLDDPLPSVLQVAYREPAQPFDPHDVLDESPARITFGIETYELVIFPRAGKGNGPTARQYAWLGVRVELP